MAEYIDREAICYQLKKQESIDGQPGAIRRARRIVANFPAADVAEVRHGHWIKRIDHYDCSVCADSCWADSAPEYYYCPTCGAKMEGDGE